MLPLVGKWAKHLALPTATIAVLFMAGSAVTRATIGSPTSTGVTVSSAPAPKAEPESNAALEAFCEKNWGELTSEGTICRFTQRHHLNLTHVGGGLALTNIPVVPHDTLRIEAPNPPDVVVGNETYGVGGESLLLASAGYLSFRVAAGQAVFSVQKVTLERCYAQSHGEVGTVDCPSRL